MFVTLDGKRILDRFSQSSNADAPMRPIEDEMPSTRSRLVHPLKSEDGISPSLHGHQFHPTDSSPVQSANADAPRLVTLFGNSTGVFKALHPLNADAPISPTPSGSFSPVRLAHPSNAEAPTRFTALGISTRSRLAHPLKAPAGMWSMLPVSVSFLIFL